MPLHFRRYMPELDWGRTYDRMAFSNDLIPAAIVPIILIPQSLAYAQPAARGRDLRLDRTDPALRHLRQQP